MFFQSPPHRGRFCDITGAGTPTITLTFQSPPHRGRFCDTSGGGQTAGTSAFQSPPHRGRFCDLNGPDEDAVDPESFSPLLIGEDSATTLAIILRWLYAPFSPLLIGEDSATPRGTRPRTRPASFSPLLIGEDSATVPDGPGAAGVHAPFSPLLIGEDSATSRPSESPGARGCLSVPSSSGKILRPAQAQSAIYPGTGLSVPSSSGKILRHDLLCCGDRVSSPFSPLLIGEDSATRWRGSHTSEGRSFQSPPHRGRFCDLIEPARVAHDVLFQSPPHRGRFCDNARP